MAAASKKMGKRNKEWQRGNTSTSTHVKNRGTGSSCEVPKEIETLCRHGPPFPSHDTLLLEALWEGCPDTVTGGQQRTGSVFCSSRNWRSVPLWDNFGVSHLCWGMDHVCQGHCFNSPGIPAAVPPSYRIWSPNHSSDLGLFWDCMPVFSHFFQGFKFNFYDYFIFSLSLLILLGFVCLFPFPDFESFST